MLPVRIDQVEKGLDRIISALSDKENFKKLLIIFLTEIQQLEDATLDLANQKNIYTASGVWLDYIGGVVGEKRRGRGDDEYRAAILLRIGINNSDGTPDVIIDIVKQFTKGSDVRLRDFTIAATTLYTNGNRHLGSEFWELIENIRPAGTRFIIHTDRDNNALLPSWEIVLPHEDLFQVYTKGAIQYLELFTGGKKEDLKLIVEKTTDYLEPVPRSIPEWELAQIFQVFSKGKTLDLEIKTKGVTKKLQVFASNPAHVELTPLCWEVTSHSTQ